MSKYIFHDKAHNGFKMMNLEWLLFFYKKCDGWIIHGSCIRKTGSTKPMQTKTWVRHKRLGEIGKVEKFLFDLKLCLYCKISFQFLQNITENSAGDFSGFGGSELAGIDSR